MSESTMTCPLCLDVFRTDALARARQEGIEQGRREERERCLRIVENGIEAVDYRDENDETHFHDRSLTEIAAAIRAQEPRKDVSE